MCGDRVSCPALTVPSSFAVHSKAGNPPLPNRSSKEATAFKFDKNRLSFHSDQVPSQQAGTLQVRMEG